MANYGFKLLEVELYKGRGRSPLDFGDVGGAHYLDVVSSDFAAWKARHEIATGAVDEEDVVDEDEADADDDAASSNEADEDGVDELAEGLREALASDGDDEVEKSKAKPVVRLESLTRYTEAILLSVRYGVTGDHDKAVHPEGEVEDQDLTGLAATRVYRALLIAPKHGKRALLAVEVIGRSHPANGLPRRLRMMNANSFTLRKVGNVADTAAVDSLLRHGKAAHVELYRYGPSAQGGSARAKEITLSVKIGGRDGLSQKVIQHVKRWVPKSSNDGGSAGGAVQNPSSEAQALAAIVWDEAKNLKFDDARVAVQSGARNRKLRPLDTAEGFIYDVGDDHLSDNKFVEEVAASTQHLFVSLNMDMTDDWALAPDDENG